MDIEFGREVPYNFLWGIGCHIAAQKTMISNAPYDAQKICFHFLIRIERNRRVTLSKRRSDIPLGDPPLGGTEEDLDPRVLGEEARWRSNLAAIGLYFFPTLT